MDFNVFINNLIKNINIDNVPREIDLVLDGGAFNGAFQLGALLYLKQMERNKMIKIKRVSGTSVGSFLGFLFIIDRLEYAVEKMYEVWRNYRKNFDLSIIKEIIIQLMIDIDKDIYKTLNKRLYITYFNVYKKKQIIKYKYKNNQEIISSIIKSSHVPYIIDGNYTYKKKYIDGVYPYIFDNHNNNGNKYKFSYKRKKLFICLSSINNCKMIMSIKNEINGQERILYGINDIHKFFKKHYELSNSNLIATFNSSNSTLCSYINNWGIINWIIFKSRFIFIILFIYIIEFKYKIYKIYNNVGSLILRENYKNIIKLIDTIKIFIKKYINYILKLLLI